MNLKKNGIVLLIGLTFFLIQFTSVTSCSYKFQDITIPDTIKTVKINFIENRASYRNPQISPALTDRLRQKIVNQTRLSQTNVDDRADWIIDGEIVDYYQTTSGITSANGRSETSINRLNVTVKIIRRHNGEEPKEFSVTRQFDFPSTQSLQVAEARLLDEMVRNLTDEIFNNLFSGWAE